jgi:hypothetical protein
VLNANDHKESALCPAVPVRQSQQLTQFVVAYQRHALNKAHLFTDEPVNLAVAGGVPPAMRSMQVALVAAVRGVLHHRMLRVVVNSGHVVHLLPPLLLLLLLLELPLLVLPGWWW